MDWKDRQRRWKSVLVSIGMTQKDFCQENNINPVSFSNWVSGGTRASSENEAVVNELLLKEIPRYYIDEFYSGNLNETMICKNDLGFPIRHGGATEIETFLVTRKYQNETEAVAFFIRFKDADKFCTQMNSLYNDNTTD